MNNRIQFKSYKLYNGRKEKILSLHILKYKDYKFQKSSCLAFQSFLVLSNFYWVLLFMAGPVWGPNHFLSMVFSCTM